MAILLIQLSDIHIKGPTDPILGRGDRIAAALRGIEGRADGVIIVISGDVAFSGSEEQYLLALGLVQGVVDGLRLAFPAGTQLELVAVPGNHDCEFDPAESVRDILIEKIRADKQLSTDVSVVDACTRVQDGFFEFYRAIANLEIPRAGRLYYESRVKVGEHSVLFRCYNTAWISQRQEPQGQIVLPEDLFTPSPAGNSLVVSVFHHPYNWFFQNNGRAFRKHVEKTSDLILTGHEHDQSRYIRAGGTGETNEYMEGGVLQETGDPEASRFNAVLIDLDLRRQWVLHFAWNGELYERTSESSDEWEPFQVNQLLTRRDFELLPAMLERLEDPEATFTHSVKGLVQLSDIYVYPDLREVSYRRDVSPIIPGSDVFETVRDKKRALITAPERSGKTSLAKALFKDYHERGFVPVLISGRDFGGSYDERLLRDVNRAFGSQYGTNLLEKYRQLEPSRRVIIVDAFHELRGNRRGRDKVLQTLTAFADHVVLLANDLTQQANALTGGEPSEEDAPAFSHYRLQEFGYMQRDRLVERWFTLGVDDTVSEVELAQRITNVHRILDTVIGKKFIPAFPIFILAVLQAEESSQQLDTNASTYGHYYELLIKASLSEGSTRQDSDTKNAYLAHLAYRMFRSRQRELSLEEMRAVHEAYEKDYALRFDMGPLLDELTKIRLLYFTGAYYGFKYKYIYFYFVAKYMTDYITEEPVREDVRQMSQKLYVEEYANIMLFLSHLSKHPFIVEQMLAQARDLYSGYTPAALSDDIRFLNEAYSAAEEVVYIEGDSSETRKELLRQRDEVAEEEKDDEDKETGEDLSDTDIDLDPILRLNVGLKTLQILGQSVKNFPGSMRADVKLSITQECYQLGLRTLSALYKLMEENQEILMKDIVRYLREEGREPDSGELEKRAKVEMFGMARAITYGIVKRISHAVGSSKLTETYRQVLEQDDCAATALVDASIKLDHTHTARFPEREITGLSKEFRANYLASSVLRQLVVTHFYMFPVDLPTRQSVLDRLQIKVHQPTLLNPGTKKIGKA